MKPTAIASLLVILAATPAAAWEKGAGYLMLQDPLDRPQDSYCLDVAGSGDWVDFSVPLNIHNCKGPHFYADEAVVFDRSPGVIRFPAYQGCVTAMGRDGRSLPQSALTLKPCVGDVGVSETPFASVKLQRFEHRDDGRITLVGSDLCLTSGAHSDVTFSPDHRWRPLFLDSCDAAPEALSVWQPFAPRRQQ